MKIYFVLIILYSILLLAANDTLRINNLSLNKLYVDELKKGKIKNKDFYDGNQDDDLIIICSYF